MGNISTSSPLSSWLACRTISMQVYGTFKDSGDDVCQVKIVG